MKRKMELIWEILQYAEENAAGKMLDPPHIEGYSMEEINYHIGLCYEAQYLHVVEFKHEQQASTYKILNVTWKGHEVQHPIRSIP